MSESEIIKELINHWITYSKKRSDHSLEAFSKWLYNELHPVEKSHLEDLRAKKEQLGQVFGRLINFAEMWGKLAFKDLPIKQFEDFGILMEVKFRENPSKNEIANLLLNEKSTAFEIIKRLIRDGLLKEEIDNNDKRIRRIRLTEKGILITEQAQIQAAKVANMLMGDSSEEEIDLMLKKFTELDRFHTSIYEKGGYRSIDDLSPST